ncbi:unnamed protein product [Brassica rapa]|uniref:Uncharacterized protein n=1 Tax=Brassica campestris TaxID=3711 RepID=A0A8D9CRN1_BRACM|nr:unnamed protein product [Brassica rapa]
MDQPPEQSTGRASMLSPRTNMLICVLMDSHGRPVPTDVLCVLTDTHRHTRTATDVLCVLTDTHGRPVCADGHTQTSCSTGRASVLSPRTSVLICVLMDSHGRPVCADGHIRTHMDSHGIMGPQTSCVCSQTATDVLCVLNRQPTWAKITQTVHGKGQRAESMDQRADMCTDGQTRTSCVLTDTDGHTRTHTDSQGRHVCTGGHPRTQPMWAKITRIVHGKGQRAESKDQRADMCTDGQPQTSCVLTDTQGHTQTATDVLYVLCVLTDTHRRHVCTGQTAHLGQNHPNSPREGPAC